MRRGIALGGPPVAVEEPRVVARAPMRQPPRPTAPRRNPVLAEFMNQTTSSPPRHVEFVEPPPQRVSFRGSLVEIEAEIERSRKAGDRLIEVVASHRAFSKLLGARLLPAMRLPTGNAQHTLRGVAVREDRSRESDLYELVVERAPVEEQVEQKAHQDAGYCMITLIDPRAQPIASNMFGCRFASGGLALTETALFGPFATDRVIEKARVEWGEIVRVIDLPGGPITISAGDTVTLHIQEGLILCLQ